MLSRKFHKEENISLASQRTCNLVQEAEYSILRIKQQNVPLYEILWEKVFFFFCHSKLKQDDLFRGSTDDLINWKSGLTLDWKQECEGGWGSRVWGMWMWCKEDWINLLSLQCAFIPNGSDMSRAQHYLSVTLHRQGKDARKVQERAGEVERATHEKERHWKRRREREKGGSKLPPRNIITTPKHANILFHRHAVMAFPITSGPECICRSGGGKHYW